MPRVPGGATLRAENIAWTQFFGCPTTVRADLDRFAEEIAKFEKGQTSAAEFRVFRVPRGVYEQRESETYMLRGVAPAGCCCRGKCGRWPPPRSVAATAFCTSPRAQDVQIHRVLLADIHPALLELYAAGLSTKGGGGNTVRNVTGCFDAGVCADEVFDPTPWLIAVTEFLLPDPLSYQLPRKYKLAFSGCGKDCAGATVNDLGFVAMRRDGAKGFAVYVGGGMGAMLRVGNLLEEFLPAEDWRILRPRRSSEYSISTATAATATGRESDSSSKKSACRNSGNCMPPSFGRCAKRRRTNRPPRNSAADAFSVRERKPGFPRIRRVAEALRRPAEAGWLFWVHIPLALGDLDADRFEKLADMVERCGEGRCGPRNGKTSSSAGSARANCTGCTPPCRPSAWPTRNRRSWRTSSPARAPRRAAWESVARADWPRRSTAKSPLRAPTSMGWSRSRSASAVAPIPADGIPWPTSVFTVARRANGRLVPHYVLQLGGRVGVGKTRLARGDQAIPAKSVPALVAELLAAFRRSPQHPEFAQFLDAQGETLAKTLAAKYRAVPDFSANKDYYIDWDAKELFSLSGAGRASAEPASSTSSRATSKTLATR